MCLTMILVGLKLQLLATSILLLYIPSVQSRCGCHGVPGPGFFAQGRPPAVNHNFEPLPQSIQPGGESKDGQYSIPNFRVLLFTPTFLDFHEQPVGMPFVQSIVLSNPSDQNDIEIRMINALPPFHASKFSKKVLAPLTNMTLDLIFLATMVGNVEHTIYIHTTQGNFPYQVFGVGLPNPYRLRAFVSARIPINGTFSPYINMYNPFSEAIQITEMYSSGNDLHLDLLTNGNENGSLWEIQPYETKAIMKAIFYSKDHGIAIRFIRIVIGPPAPMSHVVILPFELLVSSKPGLYTNVDILDFGTLRTMDEPKALNLNVMNYGNKSLRLLSIQVIPPNKAINIQFTPINLKHSKKHIKIATITYTAVQASQRRQNSGKIILHSSDEKKRLEVPYQANVLHGTLAYSVGKTSFFVGNAPKTQVLTITNTFNVTLVIYNATLPPEARHVFSIVNFSKPIMVPPGKLISPLSLYFHANKSQNSFSTVLRLYTNASIFTIPVQCYNGKVKYKVSDDSVSENKLDYGTIGTQENRTLTFDIINNNPVEVSIKEYGTQIEFARLQLLHIRNKKKSKPAKRGAAKTPATNKKNETSKPKDSHAKSNDTKSKQDELILKPSDVATFTVEIVGPKAQGAYRSEVRMKTVYETIKIPILMKTVEGTLVAKPKRIKIEKAFPGRTENYPLSVESTFGHSVALQNLSIYPEDPRFQFTRPDVMPKLHPKEKTHIGWVKFDPFYGNDMQCYVCICEVDPACDQWHQSLVLSPETWELDFNLLDKLRRKWDDIEKRQESSFNTSIVLDSSVIKSYTIPVQASLAWPNLVEQSIKFPSTHVGNVSIEEMIITNPSDHPLVVQVVPLLNYPQPDGGLDLLSDRLIMDSFSLDLNGHSLFYLPEIKDGNQQQYSQYFTDLNVVPSSKSLILLLEPRQKKSVQVGFIPEDEIPKTSIMVVRNNLTILDLVVVHGQGARTYFNINGKLPGDESALLFEIKAVHLKDCHKSTPKARVYPSFTVKRSFTATNIGQLPLHIVAMHINSYECEGYGFRILNCESFVLMPNASRKVDITFIPDFSTSRVSRKLSLITAMGQSLDFTLLATLPHHLLPLCANALPRPFWEPYLHIVAAVIMSTVFILIIFFAYFDAQKYVVQCTITAGAGASGPGTLNKDLGVYTAGTVFDLNAIAGVKVRITDNKKDKYNISENNKSNQKTSKNVSSASNVSKSFISSLISSSKPSSCESSVSSGASSQQRDLGRSLSDCTSYVTYSNSNNINGGASNSTLDEKLDLNKHTKESNGALPKRSKRRTNEVNRSSVRKELEEPREPVIVTEEIRDPWERGLMEKVRLERQRQKNRAENSNQDNHEVGGDKQLQNNNSNKNRKKTKTNNKKDTSTTTSYRLLQKENSNGSSNTDDNQEASSPLLEPKSPSGGGFTTIENKSTKQKKKIESSNSNGGNISTSATYANSNSSSGSSMTQLDKLDEFPLSGPRPDGGKEAVSRKSSKNDSNRSSKNHKKSSTHAQDKEKAAALMEIPTSPHAIAAAIVEAALVKSQAKKKSSKGKHDKMSSGSAPTSPTGLSARSSRSSSYSSIVCEIAKMGELGRSTSPSEPSPSSSNKGSPKHSSKDDGFFKESGSSSKKAKKSESSSSGGWGSYLKRLGIGFGQVEPAKPVDEPTSTGNSMFYYDNLTSLRASKQNTRDLEPIDTKAPGSGVKKVPVEPPVVSSSTLSPDSAEFVPLSQRLNKAVGSNPKKDNSWATVDDSALEHLRPPPGLSRSSQNIWGLDSLVSSPQMKEKDTKWDSPVHYSSLLGQHSGKDSFSSFDILGSCSNSDELWKSEDSEFPVSLEKDLWCNPTTTIRSSIWDAPDALMSHAGAPGPTAKRSRLGLGLDLKSEVGLSDGDSPLDPFSIWVPGVDPAAPYEGWNQDIKEE